MQFDKKYWKKGDGDRTIIDSKAMWFMCCCTWLYKRLKSLFTVITRIVKKKWHCITSYSSWSYSFLNVWHTNMNHFLHIRHVSSGTCIPMPNANYNTDAKEAPYQRLTRPLYYNSLLRNARDIWHKDVGDPNYCLQCSCLK